MAIPILDLEHSQDPNRRLSLLHQLRDALFNIGFLYIRNHSVPEPIISDLVRRIPGLFDLSEHSKSKLSKINSPHFLGYSGLAQETTQGKQDLREQFDFATELPAVDDGNEGQNTSTRDLSRPYWRLQGPNLWPEEDDLPGFKNALINYHDALADLSYRFVHLIEEAFQIPVGTFDQFFSPSPTLQSGSTSSHTSPTSSSPITNGHRTGFVDPQHRIKIAKYHVATDTNSEAQGVGPHKDSSGWLTFLYQIGAGQGLEVLDKGGEWIAADPIPGTFVVNFGNAFEAATEGAVRATVHRVRAPRERDRYSIPFFMGLPLDLKVSEIRTFMPESVRSMRRREEEEERQKARVSVEASISTFLDPRWDCLGDSVLRKWIRSHPDVGLKWYGPDVVAY